MVICYNYFLASSVRLHSTYFISFRNVKLVIVNLIYCFHINYSIRYSTYYLINVK